jgi:hypothetical protein
MLRKIESAIAPFIVMTLIAGTALLLRVGLALEHLR